MKRLQSMCVAILLAACGGGTDPLDPIDAAVVFDAPPLSDADTRLRISETGLYSDVAGKVIAADVVEYTPAYELWSDSAVKRRWILLPAGQQIDTTDMDVWQFPVGTKMFKEFVRDGVLIETRMIERTGPGNMDYWMGAYIWELDESDAFFAEQGGDNVNGTPQDVPAANQCIRCHGGEPGRILGFSAVQLSHSGPAPVLTDVVQNGWLSNPPALNETFPIIGDTVSAPALGVFHANCGHCHNPNSNQWNFVQMDLRAHAAESTGTVATTALYQTTVNVALQQWFNPNITLRIAAGVPADSATFHRMGLRGLEQMPPLATEDVDTVGRLAVQQWIESL